MRISKLPKQMNNPDEAPLYPNSPDYTNSETALKPNSEAKLSNAPLKRCSATSKLRARIIECLCVGPTH